MITLYRYLPAWGLPDVSPFCSKLEIYLRMAGWQYVSKVGNSRKAPKNKLPYIEFDGQVICDSTDIILALENRADHPHGRALDTGLSSSDRAIGRALQSMLEEHFYFILAWGRWCNADGWEKYQPIISDFISQIGVPRFAAGFVCRLIRGGVIKSIRNQGVGRHSELEINAMGVTLIEAVSDFLADKPFILGDQPRTFDATVAAFLLGVLNPPIEGPIKASLQARRNLLDYCARMSAHVGLSS